VTGRGRAAVTGIAGPIEDAVLDDLLCQELDSRAPLTR
jgi:hypothetical protein